MWKAAVGNPVNIKDNNTGDDDWETDPDFINDVNEEEQRWGSKTIEGSGRSAGAIEYVPFLNLFYYCHFQLTNLNISTFTFVQNSKFSNKITLFS